MAETMRAYRLLKAGTMPEVVEVPIPQPGPGQIRLRTAGAGLCHSDLLVIHADPPIFPVPSTLGHEATGWIDAVGSGVEGFAAGEAYGVYFPWGCGRCQPCACGNENVCHKSAQVAGFAMGRDGGMAEYLLVDDARHLVPLGQLDPIAAAPLMCAGITTYHAIAHSLPLLQAGSTAVLIGIGGLGHLAIQLIKALSPARVIAIDTQAEKREQALALGAEHALAPGEDTVARVRELTGGLGARLVLDLVGNDSTLALSGSILAQGGSLKIVGVGGGTFPLRFHEMPRDASVSVPYAGSIGDLRSVVKLAEAGLIHPEVVHIGFDALEETYALMSAGRLRGRAVLVPWRN
ncbi:MAG: NAD(P)-dependent alcohol dehydrogenase [Rhodospirillales bacterium]